MSRYQCDNCLRAVDPDLPQLFVGLVNCPKCAGEERVRRFGPDLIAALQRAAAVLAHVESRFTARDPYQPTIRAATEQAYAAIARATLSPEAYAEAQSAAGDVAEAVEERGR